MPTELPKKKTTNRDILLNTNLYDVLLKTHKTLAKRNTTCILEALDECIQRWLNQEVR